MFDKRFGLSNSKTFWSDEDLSGGAPPCSWAPEVPDVLGSSHSTFVADDLSALNLHLLVEPLPVAAALHAALACAAVRTGVEAAHAVHIQAVAHVLHAGDQTAILVVQLALGAHRLSAGDRAQSEI